MANEKLDNLVKIGSLKAQEPNMDEVAGLIRSGVAKLADSKIKTLNIESRFDLAYNASHALSLAALRICGYRSENRYLVFQCLQHTLRLPNEQWRVVDQAHRKRNIAEYEGDIDVDEQLVEALIRVADEVAERVSRILPRKDA
jgi:hypothetical protein